MLKSMLVKRLLPVMLTVSLWFIASAKTSEDMPCVDLPAPVRAAAEKQQKRKGTQPVCEKIRDNGQVFYEVKVTVESGKMREIVYRPDGQLVEVEDEGQLADIPPAARAAIQKAVAAGELVKVDIIQRGATRLYEGEYRQDGVKKKIIVDAAGRTTK